MTILRGLPDLGAPLASLPGTVFRGYEDSGLAIALPDRLDLERAADGTPVLLVTLVRGEQEPYGRIEAGFAIGSPLSEIGEAAARQAEEQGELLRVAAADPRGGVLEVTARLGPVAEEALTPPVELAPDLLTRARVSVALAPRAAVAAARLVEDATLPVTATLRLTLRAVAPRLPLATAVDPHEIAVRLAARFGVQAALTVEDLAGGLDELLAGSLAPSAPGPGDEAGGPVTDEARGRALALRLKEILARPEISAQASAQVSAQGRYLLRHPDEVLPGQERVDLAVAAAVLVDRVVTLDPFAAARAVSGGTLDRHVRRVTTPPLPAGHVVVEFAANLPEPVAGLLALLADLRIPPAPPLRPQPVTAGAALDGPGRTGTAGVVLAAGEEPSGEARLRALLDLPGGPVEVAGPWRPASDRHVLLGPADFPLPLTVVRAPAELTRLATAEVVTADGRVAARLDGATPMTAVPLRPEDLPARVVVRPTGPGRVIELPLDKRDRLDLDLVTLPGYGAQRATIACRKPPVRVEWRADGADDPPRSVRLDRDRPAAEIRWIATSPFQPGLVWRVADGDQAGPWSAPVAPAERLVIVVDEAKPLVVNGVEMRPDDAEPGVWTYLPPGPFLELGQDGRPAIGLIEAGATAFLQLTSRLDLPEAARAALLGELRRRASGEPEQVRPAPVTVRRVALEARPPDGAWAPVAEGTSSGLPPWTTALAATLDPGQAAAVKAALSGTRGRLRLVGELDAPAGPEIRVRDIADLLEPTR
ncbi:hypothetical protein [Microbispora triticiradicis]|uniref:hypothetical protein n=1 Tax=Microbispora triticiradicis TaxID=2200763 RepID=UPI001AD72C35|nr:hypothetical protein [Microbispora triticiradicis]MBO4272046.1 hypothetical protein [Microbispora triticiradicis]